MNTPSIGDHAYNVTGRYLGRITDIETQVIEFGSSAATVHEVTITEPRLARLRRRTRR